MPGGSRKTENIGSNGRSIIVLNHWSPPGLQGEENPQQKPNQENLNQLVRSFPKNFPAIDVKNLELLEKVVVVGDANAGKTCLVLKYCEEHYSNDYKSTIGVDFFWQRYNIHQFKFVLHIWDTAGQERFRSLSQSYYRGAGACIVAFDLGVTSSLQTVKKWVEDVIKESQNKKEFSFFLVGCKSDMFHVVTQPEALKVAKEINAEYFEVSAKTGDNVTWLFERIATVLFERALRKTVASLQADEEDKSELASIPKTLGVGRNKVAPTVGGGSGLGDTGAGKGTANWKASKAPTKAKGSAVDQSGGNAGKTSVQRQPGRCW